MFTRRLIIKSHKKGFRYVVVIQQEQQGFFFFLERVIFTSELYKLLLCSRIYLISGWVFPTAVSTADVQTAMSVLRVLILV